jgi:chromatin segregation and condensation protein Rec8/ScpA/Scc1 (kleisin family)
VVGPQGTVVDVLSAFIAVLELARRGVLTLVQDGSFGPLRIRRESPREAA